MSKVTRVTEAIDCIYLLNDVLKLPTGCIYYAQKWKRNYLATLKFIINAITHVNAWKQFGKVFWVKSVRVHEGFISIYWLSIF